MDSSAHADPRHVKRKRSASPSSSSSRPSQTTPLPHFHDLGGAKQPRHAHPHLHSQHSHLHSHATSRPADDSDPYARSLHARSRSTTQSQQQQHHSDSERDEHDIDAAAHSPRQARSPYATSDLRGSPSTTHVDSLASPSIRPLSNISHRPVVSSSSSSISINGVATTNSSSRYLAQHHHGSTHSLNASSARHEDAPSPSSSHSYRPRSPLQYSSRAGSHPTVTHASPSIPSKPLSAATATESSHLADLENDLASITSPQQRASSSATPQTPLTSARKMDAQASLRDEHARTSVSADPSATSSPVVKKEQSTPSEKPRGGQACLECRLAKVRCLPSDESENCQRCHRFNFECLFVQHKRGRKPKSKLQGRDLTLLAEAAYATNASPVQTDRPAARKSASTSNLITSAPSATAAAAAAAAPAPSAASPGVRWSNAPDDSFPAAPHSRDYAERGRRSTIHNSMDLDNETRRDASPASTYFPKRSSSAFAPHADTRAALEPKNLFGVDVGRMTQAMQQAMRSLERRRGAPYTLVTNNEISSVDNGDDDSSDMGATPPAPGAATAADTNAVNESFELIAEQPLTLRVMLKPFEVSDQPDCETPRILSDDRNPLASQPSQPQLNDPITQGILSEPAARALFDLFMHHCNAWSGVFDPSLHTHDFVRKRSSFLYTVLLYVGARHSRRPAAHHLIVREKRGESIAEADWDLAYADPLVDRSAAAADEYALQIRRRIHEQAREHAARAFVDGDRTVLCCQAFFILASWKPLDDGLSVIQVGYAFRLAMDIQLHAEMPNCVKPSDSNLDAAGRQRYEAVQRRFRNRQRTFLMLFVQDKSQQISNKITTHSISSDNVLIRRCQTWWRHPGSIPTDAFVCASADIRRIQGKYVELYDRIEALTSATSDGPSIMMPAFLSDLFEWNARWHEALGLREDADEDVHSDDVAAYHRRCQRLCLQLWKDNVKTYVSSLVLKSSLKQAALQEHQEIVRNHHRRSATRGTEDRDSVSGKSHLSSGLEPGMVNLMAMPAFWPCVEGARGVLEAVCAFPPERLQCAPDATIMQTTHAAVLLCSLATVKSQPPLGTGYLRSNIQLIDQTSAAFRRASITQEDTVLHIAMYLESLLRPKNAQPRHSAAATNGKTGAPCVQTGASAAGAAGTVGAQLHQHGSAMGSAPADTLHGGGPATSGATPLNGAALGASGMGNFAQFTNFTLMSNNTDMFYSGTNGGGVGGGNGRLLNGAPGAPAQDGSLFFNGTGSFDREGLDAIASAAAAAAAAQNIEEGNAAPIDMAGWSSAMGPSGAAQTAVAAPWNSLMFGATHGGGVGEGYPNAAAVFNAPNTQATPNSREQADETLRMLLRFLDG